MPRGQRTALICCYFVKLRFRRSIHENRYDRLLPPRLPGVCIPVVITVEDVELASMEQYRNVNLHTLGKLGITQSSAKLLLPGVFGVLLDIDKIKRPRK